MEWSVKGAQHAEFIQCYKSTFKEAEIAIEYYKKAAELGDSWGMIQYGNSLEDYGSDEYREWEKNAKRVNDPYAQWYFSDDYIERERLLFEATKTGNTSAMYLLWMRYSHGRYSKNDPYFEHLQKSASLGHILAQYFTGTIWDEEKNITKAYSWFKKSKTYKCSRIKLKNQKYANCELHENTRNAIFTLIYIKKHSFVFAKNFTMDVILIITHFLWDSRNENIWNF
jgi:hypothetical protein